MSARSQPKYYSDESEEEMFLEEEELDENDDYEFVMVPSLPAIEATNQASYESSTLFETMLTKVGCAYASPDLSNFLDAMYSTAAVAYQATEKAVNRARGAHYGVPDPYFMPKKLQSNVGKIELLEQTCADRVERDDSAEGAVPVHSSEESYTTLNVQFPPSFPDHRNKDHDQEDSRFEDQLAEKQTIKNKRPLHSYDRQVPDSRLRET